jgi:hypothetical protein
VQQRPSAQALLTVAAPLARASSWAGPGKRAVPLPGAGRGRLDVDCLYGSNRTVGPEFAQRIGYTFAQRIGYTRVNRRSPILS